MNDLNISRINIDDPRSHAVLQAEQELFHYYGLDYQSHFIEMEDPNLRLRVLEVGQGRPLLMVPGGSGDATMFAPLMAELPGWRIIALNRPGAGLSDGIDHRRIDLRQLAVNSIQTVVDAFDLDRVPVICNSMGGLWSIWYTLAHPEKVKALVQMGCPALALDTSAPFFMRLLGAPVINDFIAKQMQPDSVEKALDGLRFQGSSQEDIDRIPEVFANSIYHIYNLPTYLDTWKTLIASIGSLKAIMTGTNLRYSLRANEFSQVSCPSQLIWGENDPFGGLSVARQIMELMPNAHLYEMETGHLPFIDKPVETGEVINRFLDQEFEDEPEAVAVQDV